MAEYIRPEELELLDASEREIIDREITEGRVRLVQEGSMGIGEQDTIPQHVSRHAKAERVMLDYGAETRDLRDPEEIGQVLLHDVNLRTGANPTGKATLCEVYDHAVKIGVL